MQLALQAGDEVITVSHSYIATANSIKYCGAKPVFVDIDPQTFNMDPDLIEAAITPKTRAILCVHQIGMPCDWPPSSQIGRGTGIPVVEDAACAIGSEIRYWTTNGRRSAARTATSPAFHSIPRKVMSTGDGGMLTTANPELDKTFRLLRQHAHECARYRAARLSNRSSSNRIR